MACRWQGHLWGLVEYMISNRSDRILVWDNVSKDIVSLKKDILNEYEKRKNDLVEHHTGYRMEMDLSMPSITILDEQFNPCLNEYLEEFNLPIKDYNFSQWILIGWTVPGRGMAVHNDHIPDVSKDIVDFPQPLLTAIFYLSHDCEGGDLNFPDLDFKITPKNGTLIIFPSEANHEVLEYLSGERIVIQKFVFEPSA